MKKIIFALALCVLVCGCRDKVVQVVDKDGNVLENHSTTPTTKLNPHCTVEVEGCEYFVVYSAYGYLTYVHKGNCKNPIHIHNGANHE